MDRKLLMTDQSPNLVLPTNRESTNEFTSPKKFIADIKPKNFTCEGTRAIRSKFNYNLIDIINKFAFTGSKMKRKLPLNTITGEPTRRLWKWLRTGEKPQNLSVNRKTTKNN